VAACNGFALAAVAGTNMGDVDGTAAPTGLARTLEVGRIAVLAAETDDNALLLLLLCSVPWTSVSDLSGCASMDCSTAAIFLTGNGTAGGCGCGC
jgi:hypothetical protein